jgi:transcriptional regulator with XRE-family HTH domain
MTSRDDTSELRQRIAHRVRGLRVARGWSQEGLAAVAGLHRNYIGHIERGEVNVGVGNLVKLARALGVSVGELVDEDGLTGR